MTEPTDDARIDTPVDAGPISDKVLADRERLVAAQESGRWLPTYIRLSGPGWLQSAITLGGGSLAGALFLGTLGGTSMLWLQLMAITMGVVMLSAIAYVTLSTGRRPFEAINTEINPALGWGWLIATALANMIFAMPQFSLSYDAIDQNLWPALTGNSLGDRTSVQWIVTLILLLAAGSVVMLNVRAGTTAKLFDLVLKGLIGMVVICFFGVVVLLAFDGQLDFGSIFAGFIPDISAWNQPTGRFAEMVSGLPDGPREYWTAKLVAEQRDVMIAAASTAVGVNMTFLLPYSMLARGWDRPFRGLARFDLSTGMAIPYVLVTSCVVIAAAMSFHGKVDDALLSHNMETVQTSPLYGGVSSGIAGRLGQSEITPAQVIDATVAEKTIASALIRRDAFQLSQTLEPLLGPTVSRLIFGLGVLGMGFSTIIILMLINGYVFREMLGDPNGMTPFVVGCFVAGLSGAMWVALWTGNSKFFLAIVASSFAAILLPIAYVTFFLMMNSVNILGEDRPQGVSAVIWNTLMFFSVAGAIVAAYGAISAKMQSSPVVAQAIMIGIAIYAILIAIGFWYRRREPA